jgi:hypothetical protein
MKDGIWISPAWAFYGDMAETDEQTFDLRDKQVCWYLKQNRC